MPTVATAQTKKILRDRSVRGNAPIKRGAVAKGKSNVRDLAMKARAIAK